MSFSVLTVGFLHALLKLSLCFAAQNDAREVQIGLTELPSMALDVVGGQYMG